MSTYPVLNGRPIDQWKVMELKDELCRRNISTKGLKDDLVKRLFEDLQGDTLGGEGTVGTPLDDDVKEGKAPKSSDASAYYQTPMEPVMEQIVDEGSSEVRTHAGDLVASVSQASRASAVATPDVISQEAVVAAAEVNDASLADGAMTDEISVADAVAIERDDDLGSVPSDGITMKEVCPQVEGHSKIIVKKTTGEDTNKKMIIDDLQVDVVSSDLKLSAISAKGELGAEIREQEAVSSPPGAIISRADTDQWDANVVSTVPEQNSETTIPEINCGGNALINAMGVTSAKGELSAEIPEQEAVSSPTYALMSHVDPCYDDAIATAPDRTSEILIPKINSGGNALMDGRDREDSKHTNEDYKPIMCGPKDHVPEASPDLSSEIKYVSSPHDNASTKFKGNLNANNSNLELEATLDMIKPSSRIPSIGDDFPELDDDKKFSKGEISLQEIESNLDKKEDSLDGSSPEKLNLHRSSGDEMMEDVMESKHVDSNIKSDDLGGKTEFTSEHAVKEVIISDNVAIDPSVHIKETVAEGKPTASTEKRKPGAQEVLVNEPIKRQRQWSAVSVKSPEQQVSKLSISDAPNNVFRPALKPCFVRSDSTSRDPPKDRIVPPSEKPTTTSLRVDRFVRPFTLKAVQELLGQTGFICNFWMDHIKTHCYVTYSSVEEAVATRNVVYNLQWPPNHGNYLVAEFVDPHEVKLKLEAPAPSPTLISLGTATIPKAEPFQQSKANKTILCLAAGTSMGLLPTPQPLTKSPPTSRSGLEREMLPPPPKNPKTSILDDLFKRTHASPRIYYMPLSEEEVSARLASRNKRKYGR